MSKNIPLDQIDLFFLDLDDHSNFPLSVQTTEYYLKPLEEIVRDEE